MLRVHTEADRDLDRLVELGVLDLLNQRDRLFNGMRPDRHLIARGLVFLPSRTPVLPPVVRTGDRVTLPRVTKTLRLTTEFLSDHVNSHRPCRAAHRPD